MRRLWKPALGVALVLLLGLALGVGGVLGYQRFTAIPRPDPEGLPVVCDREFLKCWQAGQEVQQPGSQFCGGTGWYTSNWRKWRIVGVDAGPGLEAAYVCDEWDE